MKEKSEVQTHGHKLWMLLPALLIAAFVLIGTAAALGTEAYDESGAEAEETFTGFREENGSWYYYRDSVRQDDLNSVVSGTVGGTEGWWYVVGGKADLGYTGVSDYSNEYGWWYIQNGRVDFGKTGIEQNRYGWWRVVNGRVDFSCNSVEQNDYGWWYVLDGKVQFGYTGVADYANAYGWWYVKDGKVDFSKNSVEQNDYGWWYVLGGQVDFGFTGVSNYGNDYGWWYIRGGRVDFSHNGVDQNRNGWWYVLDGKVQFGYTGVADYANDYGWWYIRDGQVNFMFIGIAKNSYGWWYVFNGKVTFTNSEGVAAAVATAATLDDDLQSIRDFVRYDIKYNNSWGGDDSIAYGLTSLSGNCYVHAICLKALLDVKGYTANLIWTEGMETAWVTGDGHFWVQVLTEDGWRHMDGTPSSSGIYDRYLLMTDAQRQETLLGGTWDHSLWPACT